MPLRRTAGRCTSPSWAVRLAAVLSTTGALGCVPSAVPEPDLHLQLAPADPERTSLQHRIAFADGAELFDIALAPGVAKPGAPVTVRFTLTGAAGGAARVGLLPPVEAGRQYITAMGALRDAAPVDARVQWQQLTLGEAEHELSFELPSDWQPRSAVFVLERRAGDEGPAIEVVAGPRTEAVRSDGYESGVRALLGTLPVETAPLRFEVPRKLEAPTIDGTLSEGEWPGEGMALVHSLEGEPVTHNRSRVWFAWDERALYVGAKLADDDIWSEYTKRDEPLYRQEAFELFVAGGPSVEKYLEYQVAPTNVIFDAAFQGRRNGDEAFNGMWEHAVQVDGSVNERRDTDSEWSVEIAVAWPEICAQTRLACPVAVGAPLRINVFRLDKDRKGRQQGQALTPTRQPDFHNWSKAAFVTLGGAP